MRVLAAVGLLALAGSASALAQDRPQEKEAPKTRLESFLATKGALVVRDFYQIGKLRGLTLDAMVIAEPGKESTKVKGLRAEIVESGRLSTTHASFLDMDELESLAGAVDYMIRLMGEWAGQKREPYTEVVFGTKGDFKLGFYHSGTEQQVYASSSPW